MFCNRHFSNSFKCVHRILLGGSMLPCRPRRRKCWKFGYEMVHSKVGLYLNKYVVSIAPFSYPAFTPTPHSENWSFCMFSLFTLSCIFLGGQLTPFAPICGRPWIASASMFADFSNCPNFPTFILHHFLCRGSRKKRNYSKCHFNGKSSWALSAATAVFLPMHLTFRSQEFRNFLWTWG